MTEFIPRCSFCGKKSDEVEALIAGPNAFICSECVEFCGDVMLEGKVKKALQRIISDKPLRFPPQTGEAV